MSEQTQMSKINDLLFKQIERISNEKEIKDDKLNDEIERSKAMALLANQYIAGETLEMKKELMCQQIGKTNVSGYLTKE